MINVLPELLWSGHEVYPVQTSDLSGKRSPDVHANSVRKRRACELNPLAVVGDKGYDTDGLCEHWRAKDIGVRIPPKRNRLVQHACNEALYRTRHMVETSFCRLKDHRRLSRSLDVTGTSFRAFACCAAALMNLRLTLKLRP